MAENSNLVTSEAGLSLIKSFEKFRAYPYDDGRGVETIGWGHAIKPGEHFTVPMSLEFGNNLLKQDVRIAELVVIRNVRVSLTQHQFDALVSFTFNLGEGNLLKSKNKGLLSYLNAGKYDRVPERMILYVNPPSVKSGLLKRRKAEISLWNN